MMISTDLGRPLGYPGVPGCWQINEVADHTPPEGGVRTKKCYITFDTIFGRYLPRGTIIDGSQKCRMGAFCTINCKIFM